MRRTTRWIWSLLTIVVALATVGVITLITFTGCRHKAEAKQLPIIYITTDNDILWEKRIPCSISVVCNSDSTVWDGKIKFRGGISAKYYKHSYSLKFTEPHSLCGLPANRSWVLNASYIDKTFMRHKLCYDLFNMMGDNNIAPECRYALVRENNKPLGMYVVMQRLNKQVLQLDTDDTAAVIFKEPKVFYLENQYPERDGIENFHEQTYPDFEKGDCNYLMDAFRKFLTQTSDQEFYAHISEWIDIPNLIDYHLFLLFTNGGDGVKKNFYLYKKNSGTPYRIAPWDCDHSFGRDGDNEKNMLERPLDVNQNILIDRMLKNPEYITALSKRYWELRKSNIFSYETIEKLMRENDPWVRAGLEENLKLWPFDSENYYDAAGYDEEYALILEFVKLNLQHLDEYFQPEK